MTRLSVLKWVAKALAAGPMAAPKDNYHRPKNPSIGDDAKAWVVHVKRNTRSRMGQEIFSAWPLFKVPSVMLPLTLARRETNGFSGAIPEPLCGSHL
jgi:hypothetical protein